MTDHISQEDMLAFCHSSLDPETDQRVMDHLIDCSDCLSWAWETLMVVRAINAIQQRRRSQQIAESEAVDGGVSALAAPWPRETIH